ADRAKSRWSIRPLEDGWAGQVHQQMIGHMDGLIAGPTMVALSRGGILAELANGPMDLHQLNANTGALRALFDFLSTLGWIILERDRVQLTACGEYASQIATSYGVTVSYLATMNAVSTLLFGNARIPRFDESGIESLVDRAMNVWGSGGAHRTYFKK